MKHIGIISICGTRPEVIRVIKDLPNHLIVNTGQHYDDSMDAIFWKERDFEPDVNLNAKEFPETYRKVDELLKEKKPKLIISYGDTRSSFIAALAAKNNDIKVVHLEAGVRCYDMSMPEERYRIMIDSISDYLFVLNKKGKENLLRENIQGEIFIVGDLLYDKYIQKRKHKDFVLMTIHRKQNQNSEFLSSLFKKYENEQEVILLVHHAIKDLLKTISCPANLDMIEPVNHEKMLKLIRNAKLVVTDSGGVQREAFFMGVPLDVRLKENPLEDEISIFGDGHAEERIKKIILEKVYG